MIYFMVFALYWFENIINFVFGVEVLIKSEIFHCFRNLLVQIDKWYHEKFIVNFTFIGVFHITAARTFAPLGAQLLFNAIILTAVIAMMPTAPQTAPKI